MSRIQTHGIILIAVLAVLLGINARWGYTEAKGPRPDMAVWVPMNLEGWQGIPQDPSPTWSQQLPRARFMLREYSKGNSVIEFMMTESGDPGSFHSPMFCLPGAGYTIKESGTKHLAHGAVSQAEFVQDFQRLTVRYWYLSGDKLAAGLWQHKWNMLVNKLEGVRGPNFSFRVTVQSAGTRDPRTVANEFSDAALQAIEERLGGQHRSQ